MLSNFNSIKVQLEHTNFLQGGQPDINFNSIKVQLELLRVAFVALINLFQFHKGTIRTDDANVPAVRVPNFNSIKVQLEQENAHSNQHEQRKFQFHKGTIRTSEMERTQRSVYISIP